MRFEFDPDKDLINIDKHGVSLELATSLNWDAALLWIDIRKDYGETRIFALAPETGTLYYAAFVDRGEIRRMISLRRANRREVKRYVQALEEDSSRDA